MRFSNATSTGKPTRTRSSGQPIRLVSSLAAFLELHEDDGVRDLGGEPGMVDLVHDVEADDRAAPGRGDPLGVAAEAAAANLTRREPALTAALAALHDEPPLAGRGKERTQLLGDLRNRLLRIGHHEESGLRTSVECMDRIPPLPDTRMTFRRSTWRVPPWPRAWITPSETGVMPHM